MDAMVFMLRMWHLGRHGSDPARHGGEHVGLGGLVARQGQPRLILWDIGRKFNLYHCVDFARGVCELWLPFILSPPEGKSRIGNGDTVTETTASFRPLSGTESP